MKIKNTTGGDLVIADVATLPANSVTEVDDAAFAAAAKNNAVIAAWLDGGMIEKTKEPKAEEADAKKAEEADAKAK